MCFFYKIFEGLGYLLRFLKYAIISRHSGGFGIHSPFVYDFYRSIFNQSEESTDLKDIKKIRKELIKQHTSFYTTDLVLVQKKQKFGEFLQRRR